MSNDPLDLLALLVAILTFVTSREIAVLVGPYAAIAVLACSGAALSLSGNDQQMSVPRAIWYVAIRILLAITLTVSLAELLQNLAPWMKPRYTLTPLAFAIGWIKDYNAVRDWIGSVVERFTSKRINDGK